MGMNPVIVFKTDITGNYLYITVGVLLPHDKILKSFLKLYEVLSQILTAIILEHPDFYLMRSISLPEKELVVILPFAKSKNKTDNYPYGKDLIPTNR
jgi:hypothetical protein